MTWWNNKYLLRRKVIIQADSGDLVPIQDITLSLDIQQFIDMNKTLIDYQDVEVLFQPDENLATPPATPTYIVLSRDVEIDSITFPLVESIEKNETSSGEYWIYYGNTDLENAPTRPAFIANPWPVAVPYSDNRIAYTRPSEHWINGRSSTQNAKATFNFTGSNVRLISQYGPNQGKLNIVIDDNIIQTVDLFSPTTITSTAYTAQGLSDDLHKVQVFVTNEKSPQSAGVEINIVRFEYAESYIVSDGGEEYFAIDWVAYSGGKN